MVCETLGGEEIKTEPFTLTYKGKSFSTTVNNIPQKQTTGFDGAPELRQVTSMTPGIPKHAKNLFRQGITIGTQIKKFLRFGNTQGNAEATKELLANALSLKFSNEQIEGAIHNGGTLTLKFSNTQLMTPGIFGDRKKMLKQIQTLQDLAKQPQPMDLKWNG